MRRYRRILYNRMGDFTTLIAGPSGTGKELVARAIGLSRYIPFDAERKQFVKYFADSFHAVNLSALSPTLIESELFGHCRGAFTGAVGDRQGWLETCDELGTVFLDEIGELDGAIQVKMLRVLQSRVFQRLGDTAERKFLGKMIAATNRDLAAEMKAGRFREDFYYRLCSDIITTPSLREQLADAPEDLHNLILHITGRIVGEDAEPVAGEVESWIDENLGRDYAWPGNIRELEQCVRNIVIRKQYVPPPKSADNLDEPKQRLFQSLVAGSLTADEMLRQYCTIVYANLGSYEQTAKVLGLDRRTVKAKIDPDLLAELTSKPRDARPS
jgi:transcriptional regulator with PAS, ATPase and Fis domain